MAWAKRCRTISVLAAPPVMLPNFFGARIDLDFFTVGVYGEVAIEVIPNVTPAACRMSTPADLCRR